MSDYNPALEVRTKMLGVLLRDARQASGKTVKDCAAVIGVRPAIYSAYELGSRSPALPELELLAYFFDVPLRHFWGTTTISEKTDERAQVPAASIVDLRQRLIGAKLRQARVNARLKIKDFAAELGLSPGRLSSFEFGRRPIPVPELEVLANRLGLSLEDLLESEGVVGEWESTQRAFERFKQLPPELREFLSQPANESYLRLAHRLSQMSAEQLRGIAASLLDITY